MKKILLLLSALCIKVAAFAQGCSVCTKTASQLGEKGALGLNVGIVYLALLPLTFIGILAFVWWRSNRAKASGS